MFMLYFHKYKLVILTLRKEKYFFHIWLSYKKYEKIKYN